MKPYQDKHLLQKLYKEHKSQTKVAKILDCNYKTIASWMKKFDIKTLEAQGARKNNLNHEYFKTIDTEGKAYWLGFLMADGCVYKGSDKHSYRLQINLQASDKCILEKFQIAIESDYKIIEKQVNGYDVVQLKINSTQLCQDLMRYGVVPRKSLMCEMPKISYELIKHFIRGYFDGDGSISHARKKDSRFGSWHLNIAGGEAMLVSIKEYFALHDIKSAIYPIKHSKAKALETGDRINILKIFNLLYRDATVYLDRKYKKFKELQMSPSGVILSK